MSARRVGQVEVIFRREVLERYERLFSDMHDGSFWETRPRDVVRGVGQLASAAVEHFA